MGMASALACVREGAQVVAVRRDREPVAETGSKTGRSVVGPEQATDLFESACDEDTRLARILHTPTAQRSPPHCSAGFQPAVSRVSNPLERKACPTACRLEMRAFVRERSGVRVGKA